MGSLSPPRTYADWLPLLDRFRVGDDTVLDAIREGSIEWTNIVAERWTSQIASALNERLKAVSRQLQLGFERARDPFSVSRAMIDARRSLKPLRSLASLACAPEAVRKHLSAELDRFIHQTQETLERSAAQSRADKGLILKAIRDNPLTAATGTETAAPGASLGSETTSLPRGRRVIL